MIAYSLEDCATPSVERQAADHKSVVVPAMLLPVTITTILTTMSTILHEAMKIVGLVAVETMGC